MKNTEPTITSTQALRMLEKLIRKKKGNRRHSKEMQGLERSLVKLLGQLKTNNQDINDGDSGIFGGGERQPGFALNPNQIVTQLFSLFSRLQDRNS